MKKKKLVLFDIDGTLISPLRPKEASKRFSYALTQVFGKSPDITSEYWNEKGFNGMVDREFFAILARDSGISQEELLKKLPNIMEKCVEHLENIARDGKPLYGLIPDAISLVKFVAQQQSIHYGVLTGNLEPTAQWKLKHVGLTQYFSFGAYGHEADDRKELARLAHKKAEKHFQQSFAAEDIIVIGDTVNDILCAKAIGAVSIAVTTGWNVDKEALVAQNPDLLVDSLMDPRVLRLLEIE